MYAMTCTRPNVTFAIEKLGRYISNLSNLYWHAICRVLTYSKKIMNYAPQHLELPSSFHHDICPAPIFEGEWHCGLDCIFYYRVHQRLDLASR